MTRKRRGGRGRRGSARRRSARAFQMKQANRSRCPSSQLSSAEALGHWAGCGDAGRAQSRRDDAPDDPLDRRDRTGRWYIRYRPIGTVRRSTPRRGSRVPSANPPRAARRGGKSTPRACAPFPRGRRAVDRDPRLAIAIGASSRPAHRRGGRARLGRATRGSSPSASLGTPIAGAVSGGYDSGSFRIATHLLLDADGIDGGGSLRDDGGAAGGLAGASRDAGGERNLAGLSEDSHGFRGCV